MYSSMMIEEIRNRKKRAIWVLHGTISVKRKKNDPLLKKAIFEKIYKGVYGKRYSISGPKMSMMIVLDVESSRNGYVNQDALKNPVCPHYHFLLLLPSEDISDTIKNVIIKIKNKIRELDEVETAEGSVWIGTGKPKKQRSRRYKDPISDLVDYYTKSFFHASKIGDFEYEPTVFPYQLHSQKDSVVRVSQRHKRLIAKQIFFEEDQTLRFRWGT